MSVIGHEQFGVLLSVYKGQKVFNAGVFDDNGSTLADEKKIAENGATGECLHELSERGFLRILFRTSTGLVNVERITPEGRDYIARVLRSA